MFCGNRIHISKESKKVEGLRFFDILRFSGVMKLLLATTNAGKIREIRGILSGAPVELETLENHPGIAEPEETGSTFAENARLKAIYYATKTRRPAVADDSGIEIEALD